MGLPIAGKLAISILGPVVLDKLLGGKSGSEKQALAAQSQAAQAEAQLLDMIRQLGLDANEILGGLKEGGAPPVFKIDLDNPTDIEAFIKQVAPMAGFNNTLKLIQALKGIGTQNVSQGAAQAFATGARRQDAIGSIASNIIQALLSKQNVSTSSPLGSPNITEPVDFGSFSGYPGGS